MIYFNNDTALEDFDLKLYANNQMIPPSLTLDNLLLENSCGANKYFILN